MGRLGTLCEPITTDNQANELACNLSGSACPPSSQLADLLWTDPVRGLKVWKLCLLADLLFLNKERGEKKEEKKREAQMGMQNESLNLHRNPRM